jgi:beta-mannan synthase
MINLQKTILITCLMMILMIVNFVGGEIFAVNADECLLTRMQEMSLDYHFTVEQEVGSATHAFFGFNGK